MRRLALATAASALALAACGGDEKDETTPAREASVRGCESVEAPPAKPEGALKAPAGKLDPAKTYEVELTTNCGSFTIGLDPETSPQTAASFAALVRKGFFDGTVFHRIVPGFVIQGGDPTGSGMGGPGYSTRDVPPSDVAYTQGVVAMAKTAQEPPGTAGSQFYVVTGADAGLPPEYAILGKVTKGLGVTARIEMLGDPASGGAGTPTQPIVVRSARLSVR